MTKMTKGIRVVLTAAFAVTFAGLSVDYFPPTRTGFVLSSVLFVLAAYPVYRALEIGPDRKFVAAAIAFVPAVSITHELRQYLPAPFIRYSAAVMVAGSFAIIVDRIRRRRGL